MLHNSLDDIIFETRNKEYGAYSLKASYARNALIGLCISLLVTCSFCAYFIYENYIAVEDYTFSPDLLKYAKFNVDEALLKATELDPIKEKIKVIPQPTLQNKPIEAATAQIVNSVQVKEELKIVDTVAIRDSLEKVTQAEIEAEKEKTAIDTLPKFKGSTDAFRNYLVSQIKYPDTSFVRMMKGKLLISFIITPNGIPDDITIDNFADTQWGKSVILAIKASPRWQPAYRKGKPCKMQYTIPVYFAQ